MKNRKLIAANMENSQNEKYSSLGFKRLPNKEGFFNTGQHWINIRKEFDGAEGLWRIHDGLYDVSTFIEHHPGGRFWLDVTKGTDITEAFETHHISTGPELLLPKFFVRKAKSCRASPFTFEEDGFYKTLKRNVREALKQTPKDKVNYSALYADSLLTATFIFAILANFYWAYSFAILAGICHGLTTTAAHNYFHQKDNLRMYYFDFSMMQSREWRIIHAISHHLFTNTVIDLQINVFDPLIVYFPMKKSFMLRYGSWIYIFAIWSCVFYTAFFKKIVQYAVYKYENALALSDLLPFTFPFAMYVFGRQNLLDTIGMWLLMMGIGSFIFAFIGFTNGHYHPDIFQDGDAIRPKSERDWGYHQLDTVIDRKEILGNYFLVLTTFGDHALHHLFPTLDHSVLSKLYPVFYKVVQKFNAKFNMWSEIDTVKGHFQQIARITPNPISQSVINKKLI